MAMVTKKDKRDSLCIVSTDTLFPKALDFAAGQTYFEHALDELVAIRGYLSRHHLLSEYSR